MVNFFEEYFPKFQLNDFGWKIYILMKKWKEEEFGDANVGESTAYVGHALLYNDMTEEEMKFFVRLSAYNPAVYGTGYISNLLNELDKNNAEWFLGALVENEIFRGKEDEISEFVKEIRAK